MGVSGCGKSTVGADLARKFRIQFVDGDSLHPKSNVEKMTKGIPLNDEDRFPWLTIIRKEAAKQTSPDALHDFYSGNNLQDPQQPRAGIVIACSALKRTYRDLLRGSTHDDTRLDESHANLETYFVYLKGSRELLTERMKNRKGHFMATKMLDSQLETLEEPSEKEEHTEGVFEVSIDASEEEVVNKAVKAVSAGVGFKILEQ
ncbi:MAG: hypothetical protein CYPHOPRED_004684 [Cyphobasidiales sp. Tagirdzhanova-0007]|nr:MAG: hypothetical protein CYPHOPRED_004684 [Cyphobasidiales sp. Tagirdzhanova-0007]